MFVRHGQDDSTRAAPTFVPESQDENTHVKRKFYHPGKKFILGQNSSRLSCKLALTVQYIVADPGGGSGGVGGGGGEESRYPPFQT